MNREPTLSVIWLTHPTMDGAGPSSLSRRSYRTPLAFNRHRGDRQINSEDPRGVSRKHESGRPGDGDPILTVVADPGAADRAADVRAGQEPAEPTLYAMRNRPTGYTTPFTHRVTVVRCV